MNGSRHANDWPVDWSTFYFTTSSQQLSAYESCQLCLCDRRNWGEMCLLLLSEKIPHCPLNSNKEEYTNLPLILKTLCHSFPYPMSCSVYNVTVKHRLGKGNIAVKYGNLWNLTLSAASKWIREYYCINYPSNGYSCFQSWTLRRPKISLL